MTRPRRWSARGRSDRRESTCSPPKGPRADRGGGSRTGRCVFPPGRCDFGVSWQDELSGGGRVAGDLIEVELDVEAIHEGTSRSPAPPSTNPLEPAPCAPTAPLPAG